MLQNKSGFKYMEKAPCSDLMVPIWWDVVKKLVPSSPFDDILIPIHTLVVRV
jgi:hypothetical protein